MVSKTVLSLIPTGTHVIMLYGLKGEVKNKQANIIIQTDKFLQILQRSQIQCSRALIRLFLYTNEQWSCFEFPTKNNEARKTGFPPASVSASAQTCISDWSWLAVYIFISSSSSEQKHSFLINVYQCTRLHRPSIRCCTQYLARPLPKDTNL